MKKEVSISIIIPCYNEEKYIASCIYSLFDNGYPSDLIEIIVIDGNSQDNTPLILKEIEKTHSNVRILINQQRTTPKSLNIGIENARHDYIMIASAHSNFEKGYISELVNHLAILNTNIVGGVMNTKVLNSTIISNSIMKVLSSPVGVGNSMFRTGVKEATKVDTVPFGLYKREILTKAKGYDEKLIRNHDIELSKRIKSFGEDIYLIPSARCNYFARETYREMAKNNFRNGKWNILTLYITKNLESLSIRHFIPLVFVLSILTPLLFSILYFPFIYLSFFILFIYSSLILFASFKLKERWAEIPYLGWGFLKLHFSYGLGMLYGLFHFNKLK